MSKTKTRNTKSNYYKDSLSSDSLEYKTILEESENYYNTSDIVLIKYKLLIQYCMTLYLLPKHLITISLLFVLPYYPNLIQVLTFLVIHCPVCSHWNLILATFQTTMLTPIQKKIALGT